MKPESIGKNYDDIADWWLEQMRESTSGIAALERALSFLQDGRFALDVGCGGEGRFLRMLSERGFRCHGVDISQRMISLARQRFPQVELSVGDICSWQLPRSFDLITAWDSIFHLPLESHDAVLSKLCRGLTEGGVLLFTGGGGDRPGEVAGEFGGRRFEYSTPGVPFFVECLLRNGCSLQHLEYDQYPENHVCVIAKKIPFTEA